MDLPMFSRNIVTIETIEELIHSQACIHPMLLYAQLVCTLALYVRRRVNMKIIKIMKINVFHCIRLCKTSLYFYLLRQRRSEWSDVSVRQDSIFYTRKHFRALRLGWAWYNAHTLGRPGTEASRTRPSVIRLNSRYIIHFAPYLTSSVIESYKTLCSLRISAHNLMTEKSRYLNIPLEQRPCIACDEIEDISLINV